MKAFLSKMSNKPLDKKQQLQNKRWDRGEASLHSVSAHCGQKFFCKKIFVIGSYGCGNRIISERKSIIFTTEIKKNSINYPIYFI